MSGAHVCGTLLLHAGSGDCCRNWQQSVVPIVIRLLAVSTSKPSLEAQRAMPSNTSKPDLILARLLQVERLALAVSGRSDCSLAKLLLEVKEDGLFRARGYPSFGEYVDSQKDLFRVGRRQAYRLLRGCHILKHLRNHSLPPTSEKQVGKTWCWKLELETG